MPAAPNLLDQSDCVFGADALCGWIVDPIDSSTWFVSIFILLPYLCAPRAAYISSVRGPSPICIQVKTTLLVFRYPLMPAASDDAAAVRFPVLQRHCEPDYGRDGVHCARWLLYVCVTLFDDLADTEGDSVPCESLLDAKIITPGQGLSVPLQMSMTRVGWC